MIINLVYNNLGFIFENAPDHFDSIDLTNKSGAYLLAHDLLEHDPIRDNGSVECELMAIGAACYGRGNHGEVTISGIENDIIFMARESMLDLKPTTRGIKKFDCIEWIIEGINLSKLKQYITDELCEDNITDGQLDTFIKLCFQYMRIGARRANKKFGSTFNLYNMMENLAYSLVNSSKYFDEYTETMHVKIIYNKNLVEVFTKNIDFDDDYYY